jgi:hypothetical protein
MSKVLGLDISTSCCGCCLLHDEKIIVVEGIEFKKCNTMFEKADVVAEYLKVLWQATGPIDRLCVEEALLGFRPGMSSAKTISQLMRFNGMVSYIARNVYRTDPEYVSASHARKMCGIKMQKTAVAGPQKEQVFSYMTEHDLKDIVWPLTKTGKVVAWSRDATDAYVIAKTGNLLNT